MTDICHHILGVRHAGHVYVDDWIWLFDEYFALLQASLTVMVFVGLGAPLSWKKFLLGKNVPWLGLVLDLMVPAWLLPQQKISRIIMLLETLLTELDDAKSPTISRQTMESGTGLLLWVAEYIRELRPWLASLPPFIGATRGDIT